MNEVYCWRCQYIWTPRKENPKSCPECKTRLWRRDLLYQHIAGGKADLKTQKRREMAILYVCKYYAYKDKETYLISYRGLAVALNDCFFANDFVSKKYILEHDSKQVDDFLPDKGSGWQLLDGHFKYFKPSIIATIKQMKGAETINQLGEIWYRIPIPKKHINFKELKK